MAKKKTAETANIKAAPVLRADDGGGQDPSKTKSYCIRDDWKDINKVNYVAFKSVDGDVQDLLVNGEPAGGGGGGDFSTAEVIINMSTASGNWTSWNLSSPLPILTAQNEIKESVTTFPQPTHTFNSNVIFYQNTPYERDIYSGNEYPLTATVTGNISIIGSEPDAVSVSIAGAGTISVVINDLA